MAEVPVDVSGAGSRNALSPGCQLGSDARPVLIRVIGPVELVIAGNVVSLRSSRARRLVAMLALYRNRVVSSDRLIDAVWGEALPAEPTAALQSHLSRLRASLGDAAAGVDTTSGGYRLRTDVFAVDIDEFEALLASAREGQGSASERAALLDQAVAMVRGAAYEDLEVDDAYIEARRIQELAVAARLSAAAAHVEAGAAATPVVRRVPAPMVEVIGRDADLQVLGSLLASRRIITVTGPGGVGKTTLALTAVQRHCAQFEVSNAFVDLAPVSKPEHTPEAFARALGVDRTSGQPWADRLAEAIGGRRLVLLVDNAEHVLEPTAEVVAELAARTDAVVLTTSRAPLNLAGEYLCIVEPLDFDTSARDLFYERARAVRPSWAIAHEDDASIRTICRRVDGLPLAIEIAAAQLRWQTAAEVVASLERPLDALDPVGAGGRRARDLRSVINRSYRLLDEQDQSFLDHLGVFAGGITAASAAAVWGGDGAAHHGLAVRTIGSLVQHSLVRPLPSGSGTRYVLLDAIRHFALERLEARGATRGARHRHAAVMLHLVEEASRGMWGAEEPSWVARLDDERADICAAQQHLLATGDVERAARLATAAYWVAWPRGWSDLRGLIAGVVVEDLEAAPDVLAPALAARADLSLHAGETEAARRLAHSALAAAGGRAELACLGEAVLADLALFTGRTDEAVSRWRAARDGLVAGHPFPQPWATAAMALALVYGDRLGEAADLAAEAVRTADALGCATARAFARYAAGEASRAHDPVDAEAYFAEAIVIATSASVSFVANLARLSLATCQARRGNTRAALLHYPVLLQEWRRSGHWAQQWISLRTLVPILVRAGMVEAAAAILGGLHKHNQAEAWGADAEDLRAAEDVLQRELGGESLAGMARGAAITALELVLLAEQSSEQAAVNLGAASDRDSKGPDESA